MDFTNNFAFDNLTPESQDAIRRAICSRGMRKGKLKQVAPLTYMPEYAAWMAIMGELNSARVSIYGVMGMTEEQKDIFIEVGQYAEFMHVCVNETLQNPFEFNLYHYHKQIDEMEPREGD